MERIGTMTDQRGGTVRTSLLIHAASLLTISLLSFSIPVPAYASSGTEGAAFLDIPVGAAPAALGASYVAMANDAYAATYNPGALGFLDSTQFSGQHLSYI